MTPAGVTALGSFERLRVLFRAFRIGHVMAKVRGRSPSAFTWVKVHRAPTALASLQLASVNAGFFRTDLGPSTVKLDFAMGHHKPNTDVSFGCGSV
jgi:hypothetical protein